jgi:hypothetical protein
MTSTHTKFYLAIILTTILFSGCKKDNTSTESRQLSGEVTNDLVLEDNKALNPDYIVSGTLTIKANVLIKPGTIIQLKEGATILVESNGSTTAEGTLTDKILFTTTGVGNWNAIIFYSQSILNKLYFCTFAKGGIGSATNPRAMVIVGQNNFGAGAVSIRDCVFEAGVADGLFISDLSTVRDFYQNTFIGNAGFPITLTTENTADINSTASFANNGKNYVEIRDCVTPNAGKNNAINKLPISYYISGNANFFGKDTIKSGVEIKLEANAAMLFNDIGSSIGGIIIQGTSSEPVTIDAPKNAPFGSLTLRSSGIAEISYAVFRNGGATTNFNGQQASVIVENTAANVFIRDCVFDGSGAYGIDLGGNKKYNADIVTSNTFTNCPAGQVNF